ncbi:MAG TPA: ABC transporter permease [Gemmatimonadaceae bacterium]|nr:ABC transporter permease [Gemmatimonadaceae bacterium]
MITLIALRNFLLRPWRSLFLLLGYSLGVAVMIVLLSIGEALLSQAREERLVGGGQVTVLPEGIDVEVLKTGGLGGMFFSIDHARFIYRQLLAAPRLSPWIAAAAPQIDSKLLYLRTPNGREIAVQAAGEIPSLTRAVGAAPELAGGRWEDDDLDRRWRDPTSAELRDDIDHFHLPPASARGDTTWGEWHYFNVVSSDHKRWAYVSLIVGGLVPDGPWGGQVLITLHEQGGTSRRFVASVPASTVRFSTTRADLTIGESSVHVLPDGRYAVHARAREETGGATAEVSLTVSPTPGAYFPGAALSSGEVVSGYVVPALRADADGSICIRPSGASSSCEQLRAVQAYHDHNWGVWRGVSWEWGAARAGQFAILYGRVEPPDSVAASQPLFVYVVDSLGFLRVFRPRAVTYEDGATVKGVRVPRSAELFDARGDDTLRVSLSIEDATVTDTRRPLIERGDYMNARRIARPFFIQMKGMARLEGRIAGRVVHAQGYGFFETYR